MCGIAEAGLALSAISTVAGMGGQVMSATNQSKSAKAQAEVQMQQARNQQALAEQQAQNEISKGIAEENRSRRQASKQQGELASMLSASGFQMDSGSMLGILTDSAEEAQYDSNIILNNAEQAAWGHLVNANNAGNSYAAFEAAKANSGVDGLALGNGKLALLDEAVDDLLGLLGGGGDCAHACQEDLAEAVRDIEVCHDVSLQKRDEPVPRP